MTKAIYSRTKASAGFTLLEMLVVLAILGVLSMVALPRLRLNEGARLRQITHALIVDVRLIRDEAIRQGTTTAIVPTNNGYRLLPSGRTQTLPKGMSLLLEPSAARLIPEKGGNIRFFPDGSATGGSLRLNQGSVTVRVSVTGADGDVQQQ